jgi:hypothetical protein
MLYLLFCTPSSTPVGSAAAAVAVAAAGGVAVAAAITAAAATGGAATATPSITGVAAATFSTHYLGAGVSELVDFERATVAAITLRWILIDSLCWHQT